MTWRWCVLSHFVLFLSGEWAKLIWIPTSKRNKRPIFFKPKTFRHLFIWCQHLQSKWQERLLFLFLQKQVDWTDKAVLRCAIGEKKKLSTDCTWTFFREQKTDSKTFNALYEWIFSKNYRILYGIYVYLFILYIFYDWKTIIGKNGGYLFH